MNDFSKIAELNSKLKTAESLLKETELEIRTGEIPDKVEGDPKVWLRKQKKRLEDCKKNVLLLRNSVPGGLSNEAKSAQMKTEHMEKQSKILQDAKTTLAEVEKVGQGINFDLSQQRDTLYRTQEKVDQANADLGYGDRLLTSNS